jgi:POT family proton-dependent oligopeptide transporter
MGGLGIWTALTIKIKRKQHPDALFKLFMVEIWERFSYYGMRAMLILFLCAAATGGVRGGLGISKSEALGIYAAFVSLVYITPLLGGKLSDKIMGIKTAVILGSSMMAAGQFCLAFSGGTKSLVYIGLGLLVVGNGFFKPNISTLIGKLYKPGDARRDGAFTLFYMGINIGAWVSPLLCGALRDSIGWSPAFATAGLGMTLGLVIFLWTMRSESDVAQFAAAPALAPATEGTPGGFVLTRGKAIGIAFLCVPIACLLILKNGVMDWLLGGTVIGMISYMVYLSVKMEKIARERIVALVALFGFCVVFWSLFELAGSAITIFTENNVEKSLFGVKLTTESFQSFNAAFVVLLAPLMDKLWTWMAKIGKMAQAPIQFGSALILVGLGFVLLKFGVPLASNLGLMPAVFLAGMYLLHTIGELCISPIGLSLVTKLSPVSMTSFLMGFWFLATACAGQVGKWISRAAVSDVAGATPMQTLHTSVHTFVMCGLVSIGCGLLLYTLSPMIKRWMHQDEVQN